LSLVSAEGEDDMVFCCANTENVIKTRSMRAAHCMICLSMVNVLENEYEMVMDIGKK